MIMTSTMLYHVMLLFDLGERLQRLEKECDDLYLCCRWLAKIRSRRPTQEQKEAEEKQRIAEAARREEERQQREAEEKAQKEAVERIEKLEDTLKKYRATGAPPSALITLNALHDLWRLASLQAMLLWICQHKLWRCWQSVHLCSPSDVMEVVAGHVMYWTGCNRACFCGKPKQV